MKIQISLTFYEAVKEIDNFYEEYELIEDNSYSIVLSGSIYYIECLAMTLDKKEIRYTFV